MIDDFLTSPDELPLARPRHRPDRSGAALPAAASAQIAPRTAIAAGVVLAVSLLGAAPAAATPSSKSTLSKSALASEDAR